MQTNPSASKSEKDEPSKRVEIIAALTGSEKPYKIAFPGPMYFMPLI